MDAGSRLLQNAVPFFLLLILAELYVDRRRGTHRYRRFATWSDLAVGSVSQVGDLLLKAACLPVYAFVYEHARLLDLARTPWLHWGVALVGVDFLYYFWHRAGHEVRLLWAIHAVHHQSEDMNLGVALRQPAFQAPTVVLFFLPLACLGVTPTLLTIAYACNLIYQFFVHTQAVRSLGPLDWVLNTPSHHRVHHGCDSAYLDKNYGGILIIWDRCFGTFAAERAAPRYGVTTPLASFNPLWANVVEFDLLVRQTRQVASPREFFRLWLGHPAWTLPEPGESSSLSELGTATKYDAGPDRPAPYAVWQAVMLFLVLNTLFLVVAHAEPRSLLAIGWAGGAVFWTALGLLGLVEHKPWLRMSEYARVSFIVLGAAVSGWLLQGPVAALAGLLAALGLVALPLRWLPRA
jgi:sterol desaturase/sphingolipid hydroxylase (fatty acid hydroxylase superfamily)